MIKSLKSLASELLDCQYLGEDVAISGAHINSQEIQKGMLFVALKGIRDGHAYIENAIENGARAVLVSRQQVNVGVPQLIVQDTKKALFDLALAYRKQLKMPVLSLTGSCGKTTTKEMLVCMLSALGQVHYSQGNFNNDLGVPMTILSTPKEADFLVLEAGTNAPGEIPYLATLIQPDYAGITNVSASHLEKLKTLDGVMLEKGALLQSLSARGVSIINIDDMRIQNFAKSLNTQKITFSIKSAADVYLVDHQRSAQDLAFDVSIDQKTYQVRLPIVGLHNIQNTLMAISFIEALGLDMSKAVQALTQYKPYKGRFSLQQLTRQISVIDDSYNASVQSVKAAIEDLACFAGKKYLVLSNMGELGDKAEYYHQEVGCWIKAAHIDYVYLYGNPTWMEMVAHNAGENAVYFENKAALTQALIDELKKNPHQAARVLVKGSRANKMEDVLYPLCQGLKNTAY